MIVLTEILVVLLFLTYAALSFMSGKLVVSLVFVALASGIAGLANSLY